MTTIEDLPTESISDLSTDEAIELLRQIRLSRRTYKPSPKKTKSAQTKAKKKTEQKLTPAQAKKLLEILEGEL